MEITERSHNLTKSPELSEFVRVICDVCRREIDRDVVDIMNEECEKRCKDAVTIPGADQVNPFKKEDSFRTARKLLQGLFLEDAVKKKWDDSLTELEKSRKNLLEHTNLLHPFPPQKDIENYLNQYYELLTELLEQKDCLENFVEQGNSFVQSLLDIDINFEKGSVSLYAPGNLDALFHLYRYLGEYRLIPGAFQINDSEQGAEFLLSNCREVIISKMLRDFRWTVVYNGELWQVALPAALSEKERRKELAERAIQLYRIPIRRLSEYNSYEGINEIRLFDKIIYELAKRKDSKAREESFSVYIVGDIHKNPLIFLCRLVEKVINTGNYGISKDQFSEIHYRVYTNTEDSMENEETVASVSLQGESRLYDTGAESGIKSYYQFVENAKQFTHQTEFEKFIDGGDLIFILDSVGIYQGIHTTPIDNVQIVQENIRNAKARVSSGGSSREDEEFLTSRYHKLRELLTAYLYQGAGRLGTFHKKINGVLLKKIGEKVRTSQKAKAVYAYVSDTDAIEETEYSAWSVIRLERYNEKQFQIIQMTNRKDQKHISEANNHGKKMLVFNIWQVVKATSLYNIEEIGEKFSGDLSDAILRLRNTFVGVDYRNWKEGLTFYLEDKIAQVPPEVLSDSARKSYGSYASLVGSWLKCAVMPFFKDINNIFASYFVKSFATFLYSDAKSISDMLFVYIFWYRHSHLAGGRLFKERRSLKDLVAVDCKYSYKQFYLGVMTDYDSSSRDFPDKYRKLWAMNYEDEQLGKKVFRDVKEACLDNSYGDSFLCSNMDSYV